MLETEANRAVLTQNKPLSKRQIRAARTRAEALSPVRIHFRNLTLPFLALSVALSVSIRSSDYEPPEAMAHLIAPSSCANAYCAPYGLLHKFRSSTIDGNNFCLDS